MSAINRTEPIYSYIDSAQEKHSNFDIVHDITSNHILLSNMKFKKQMFILTNMQKEEYENKANEIKKDT